ARLEGEPAVALVQQFLDRLGMRRDHLVEDVVLVDRDRSEPPPGAAEVLAVGVDSDGVLRELSHQRTEARDERAIDVVGQQDQIVPLLEHLPDFLNRVWRKRDSERIARIDDEECLDLRVEELYYLFIRILKPLLLLRMYLDVMEVVVLQMRHLQVGREDRYPERYRVAGVENPVGFQRLENVAHRGGAPFYRIDLELAFRPRVSAHGPLQVLVNDLFVMHQHA